MEKRLKDLYQTLKNCGEENGCEKCHYYTTTPSSCPFSDFLDMRKITLNVFEELFKLEEENEDLKGDNEYLEEQLVKKKATIELSAATTCCLDSDSWTTKDGWDEILKKSFEPLSRFEF